MDFLEACKLINQVCVLTDSEKSRMIAGARKKKENVMKALKSFKEEEDELKFYDESRKILDAEVNLLV